MSPDQLRACLAHLEAAEAIMEEAGDLAGLTRLSLAMELLRRGHGLADRPIDLTAFTLDPARRIEIGRKML